MGDKLPTGWTIATRSSAPPGAKLPTETVAAFPLGGRVKIDPWSDQLQFAKNRPQAPARDTANLAFRITPVNLYLTRQQANAALPPASATANRDAGPH